MDVNTRTDSLLPSIGRLVFAFALAGFAFGHFRNVDSPIERGLYFVGCAIVLHGFLIHDRRA